MRRKLMREEGQNGTEGGKDEETGGIDGEKNESYTRGRERREK